MIHKDNENPQISDHILQTSSNLLGICFVLLSLLKVNKLSSSTALDELLMLPILLFFSSSFLSYMSLRKNKSPTKYEIWADKIFIFGLLSITVISLTFVFEVLL